MCEGIEGGKRRSSEGGRKKSGEKLHYALLPQVNFGSLVPRLSPCANEKSKPLFRTASDGKLGGAWERGYNFGTHN